MIFKEIKNIRKNDIIQMRGSRDLRKKNKKIKNEFSHVERTNQYF